MLQKKRKVRLNSFFTFLWFGKGIIIDILKDHLEQHSKVIFKQMYNFSYRKVLFWITQKSAEVGNQSISENVFIKIMLTACSR